MTWFKVDDSMYDHPKFLGVPNSAKGLWLTCGSWSAKQLTDGYVPASVARQHGTPAEARKLIDAGLWTKVDGGFQFHDWSDHNPTKTDVLEKRAATAERQRRAREKAAQSRGESRVTDDGTSRVTDASRHASPDPTRPDPTRKDLPGLPTAAAATPVPHEIDPERQQRRDQLVETLADLPTAWDLPDEAWPVVDQALERLGVLRAAQVCRRRAGDHPPRSARAWVDVLAKVKPPRDPGSCEVHHETRPCRGCAADTKAAR